MKHIFSIVWRSIFICLLVSIGYCLAQLSHEPEQCTLLIKQFPDECICDGNVK